MLRRFKFYSIGVTLGLIVVFFIFGNRKISCNVMPNERVLTEVRSKKIIFSEGSKQDLIKMNIKEQFIIDSVFTSGKINFSESNAQKEPCPDYIIYYNNYKVKFEKCKNEVNVIYLKNKL